MNTELRNRLEEAAYNIFPRKMESCRVGRTDANQAERMNFEACAEFGAELGYKEAIKVAKEWLKEQGKDWNEGYGVPFNIADFENHMNKLWNGEE